MINIKNCKVRNLSTSIRQFKYLQCKNQVKSMDNIYIHCGLVKQTKIQKTCVKKKCILMN